MSVAAADRGLDYMSIYVRFGGAGHGRVNPHMHEFSPWVIDVSQILTRRELASVMTYNKTRSGRLHQVQQNLTLVRLACCCGLRASEIGGLHLADVVVDIARPYLNVRAETAKGGHPRRVPLWWDAGTLADVGGDQSLETRVAGARRSISPTHVNAFGQFRSVLP